MTLTQLVGNVNKLTLNISKTNFISFGKGCQNANLNITINSADVERVYSTKFLGIHIDHKLNWKVHINYISNKLSKSVAIISKARSVLDTNSLRILYNSLFLPYFSYCIEVWGNTYQSNIKCISLLQKKMIRIISGCNRTEKTGVLFYNLKLLKVKDVINYKTAIIMYKASKRLLPKNIQKFFEFSQDNVRYGLR